MLGQWIWNREFILISLNTTLVKELSLLTKQSKIMIIGEADTGKNNIITTLAHWFLNKSQKVAVVDPDIGQSDMGPGFVSYGVAEQDVPAINHKQWFGLFQ